MASDNGLLLDVEVDPWGSTISIEDLDTDDRPGVPDGFKTDIWCWFTMPSIDVYTMSQDESEMAERPVGYASSAARTLRAPGQGSSTEGSN